MTETPLNPHADDDPPTDVFPAAPRLVRSEELFRGQQVLVIEHAGERYLLRITPRNRLLLQK